jgi:hypothetical protein
MMQHSGAQTRTERIRWKSSVLAIALKKPSAITDTRASGSLGGIAYRDLTDVDSKRYLRPGFCRFDRQKSVTAREIEKCGGWNTRPFLKPRVTMMIDYIGGFVKSMIARRAMLLVDMARTILIVECRLFLLSVLELIDPRIAARDRLRIYPFEKFGRILGGVFHSHHW